MSVETTLADVGNDVLGFFARLKADIVKAKAIWNIISDQQTRAILIKVGTDAITAVKDATAAASAAGLNITLDAAVVSDIKQLLADGKAGEGVIVADLKTLGITL